MHRIALLLELAEDEAEQIVAAISATEVRFAGLQLAEVLDLMRGGAPVLGADAIIAHDVCSDGVLYAGGAKFKLVRL